MYVPLATYPALFVSAMDQTIDTTLLAPVKHGSTSDDWVLHT